MVTNMNELIKTGSKFFWNPAIFPYYIVEANEEYVYYKRNEYKTNRVYRYVFEDAIKSGWIEFISE